MEGGPWAADAAVRPSVRTRLGFSEGRGAKTAMIPSNKSFWSCLLFANGEQFSKNSSLKRKSISLLRLFGQKFLLGAKALHATTEL